MDGFLDLIEADEDTVVHVADGADGNIELEILVVVIGLGFAEVVFHAASPKGRSSPAVGNGALFGDDTNVLGAVQKDAVRGNEFLHILHAGADLFEHRFYFVPESGINIARQPADAGIAGGQARAAKFFE